MTTIETGAPVVTLINVFTVAEDRQRELVDVLVDATEKVIRHRPGFVSANIHRSLDGTRVTNYAQWRSTDDMQAMRADPACQEHMAKAASMAEFDPHLYEVESVHGV